MIRRPEPLRAPACRLACPEIPRFPTLSSRLLALHTKRSHLPLRSDLPLYRWEEILFRAGAATNSTIVNAWSRHRPPEITKTGRKAIESYSAHFYFTAAAPGGPDGWAKCWYNISTGVPASERHLLLGGEMSMWSDSYCHTRQCGAYPGATPIGSALFPPSRDDEFAASIGGMIWPRGYVGAAAFWGYNGTAEYAHTTSYSPLLAAAASLTDLPSRSLENTVAPSRQSLRTRSGG